MGRERLTFDRNCIDGDPMDKALEERKDE